MLDSSWLWALFTVIAAFSQTVRNAAQRQLTTTLGTVGATHVRFLFGFPFALVFLAGVLIAGGDSLPRPGLAYWAWVLDGALAQIAATALMLAAMNQRSFVVTIAYIKTEPVQVALFGLVLLGDAVTPCAGARHPGRDRRRGGDVAQARRLGRRHARRRSPGSRPAPCSALSAVGFRGAILSLGLPSYLMAATFTLAIGLLLQSVLLTAYLWLRDPKVLTAIMRAWRPSLFAGFVGALASQFWFLAFALATAASVRTLGAGRGAVRAGDLALRVQAADHAARDGRHRADRDRLHAADLGLVASLLRRLG